MDLCGEVCGLSGVDSRSDYWEFEGKGLYGLIKS